MGASQAISVGVSNTPPLIWTAVVKVTPGQLPLQFVVVSPRLTLARKCWPQEVYLRPTGRPAPG